MEESNNDILITANFIRDINATIYEYFNDVNILFYMEIHNIL